MPRVRLVAIFGLFALLFLILLLFPGSREAKASTYFIEADGSGDVETIQEAMELADPGDDIQLGSGTFTETITISKEVNLRGISRDETVLQASNADHLITIRGVNDIKIAGLTLKGYERAGILVENASGTSISDIKGQAEPEPVVWVRYSASVTIGNSAFYQCSTGIFVERSDTINIEGCYFIGCDKGVSGSTGSNNLTVTQSTFSTNNLSISLNTASSVTISGNEDDDSEVSVGLLRVSDVMIISNEFLSNLDTGVIADLSCNDIKVEQNTITGSGRTHKNGGCISIFNSNVVTIGGNTLDSKSSHTIYLSNLEEVHLSLDDMSDITLDEVTCKEINLMNTTAYLVDSVFDELQLDEDSKLFVLNSLYLLVTDRDGNVVEGVDMFIRDNGAPIYATEGYSNGTSPQTAGSDPFLIGSFRYQVYLGNTTPEMHEILLSAKYMDWEESNMVVDLSTKNAVLELRYDGYIEKDDPLEPDDPENGSDPNDDGGEPSDDGVDDGGDEPGPDDGGEPEPDDVDDGNGEVPDDEGGGHLAEGNTWFEENKYYLLVILFSLVLVFTYSITVLVLKIREMDGKVSDEKKDEKAKPRL